MISRIRSIAIVLVLLAALLAAPLAADAQSYAFTSAPISSQQQLSLGFVFTPNSDILVNQLGYYDHQRDGFLTQHEVGIFDASGSLLTSTLLSAGTAEALDGKFRYKAITPLMLSAGQSYTIAATTYGPNDPWAYGYASKQLGQIEGFVVSPDITIADDASRYLYQTDDVLRRPIYAGTYVVYAGPNFKGDFRPAGVPAPGALLTALMGAAPGACLLLRRRKAFQG